jgi:IS5 family transposase
MSKTDIPESIMSLVKLYLKPLLIWFSDKVYAELVHQAKDHLLVKLEAVFDFAPLETACAGYHHASGAGTKPIHTVSRLVRALLVKYLFDWSLRQLEFQIRYNLIVKWFVGYSIFAAGPDHSTLDRFEQWVTQYQHRSYFDVSLRQIDQDFPEERQKPQMGDTYAMQADAAKESLVRVIRHTCQRMLYALASMAPKAHQRVIEEMDHTLLFGPEDEASYFRMDSEERKEQLRNTVVGALQCVQWVRAQLTSGIVFSPQERQELEEWLARVDKILSDEVHIAGDDEQQVTQVTRLSKERRGSYRIGSATDPEATYRVHGKGKVDLGYNVNVAATTEFIREIRADTGAQPDAVAIPDLLKAQMEQHGVCPPKFIYDGAAGKAKYYAQVTQVTQGGTQLVAPLADEHKDTARFTPHDFTLSTMKAELTCPHGQTSRSASRSGDGWTFCFSASLCQGCAMWTQCRDPKANPQGIRHVFISDYRPFLEEARAYNKTADFKVHMKLRPHIERIIAAIVRHNGGRRARRRGNEKADFQAKMNAMACNIKHWLHLLETAKGIPASAGV